MNLTSAMPTCILGPGWTVKGRKLKGPVNPHPGSQGGEMTVDHPRRKVLIIEDEPSIRNIIYVLLAGANCDGEIAYSGKQALGMISRSSFDAVLLDIRSAAAPPEEMVSQMMRLRPSLVGRVLVITGEIADSKILDWLENHSLHHLPGNLLMQDLWERLRGILGIAPAANKASEER